MSRQDIEKVSGSDAVDNITSVSSPSTKIFERHGLRGGPVTSATIRFPPPAAHYVRRMTSNNNNTQLDEAQTQEQYNLLRAQGRIVLSRGPWIESYPLIDEDTSSSTRAEEKCFKILAFGEKDHANNSSSTMECVTGMIFPSSYSSLSYLNDDSNNSCCKRRRRRSISSELISVIAYGGRRLSFISGGGLWNKTTVVVGKDHFVSIPIVKSKKQKEDDMLCTYLEVSDYIHDVRILDGDQEDRASLHHQHTSSSFLIAMGMVNNNCEIWGFHCTKATDGKHALKPTRLQCITCDVRCMTYSLSFYGWDIESISLELPTIPSLLAASGTVFGDVIVWGVVDHSQTQQTEQDGHLPGIVKKWCSSNSNQDATTSRIRVNPLHTLKGHLGSVFAVKFSDCGNYIASTSDDRSLRLWALALINEPATKRIDEEGYTHAPESTPDTILQLKSSHSYKSIWTGWGHTARVWDVSFASSSSSSPSHLPFPLLVSAGEDSVARVWSPLSSNKEVTHPLRGHRCESLWSVDVCEGIILTSGNDGSVKLFDLESRIRSESTRTITVPKDLTVQEVTANGKGDSTNGKNNSESKDSCKKKKKKRAKHNGQAICGMEFYEREEESKLLVATRAGYLFSFGLTSSEWTDHGRWSESVVLASNNHQVLDINPSSGNCIGVHPNGECAIVGTTEGWLIISHTVQSMIDGHNNVAFQAQHYRSAQSVSFINDNTLLVLYARGTAILFKFDESPSTLHIMTMDTSGIPLSFACNIQDEDIYIGDSRGNIAYFNYLSQTKKDEELMPSSLLSKAHGREHVTGMTILTSSRKLVSVGNDGCITYCTKDINDQLQKLMSIPIPNVTGLRHIWNVSQPNGNEGILIGGYHGNDFVMLDNTNGYEFLRINTGGRQRQNCISANFGMAILTGQKDGSSMIDLHFSPPFIGTLTDTNMGNKIRLPHCIGSSFHAETINDICWVESKKSTYLLTGSNDCTVKLSQLEGNTLVSTTMELPPHESCIRGVCSSQHPNSDSSLLVTCGGKLSMECYILDDHQVVSSLCSYRTLDKTTTIDHRMNVVRATYLGKKKEEKCHLVVAGDSDGNLHLCVISEKKALERSTTIGTIVQGSDGRPVLCLELLRCLGTILVFVGTTGGHISVWAFPDSIISDKNGLPTSPIYKYTAHQTGVNDLSVAIAHSNNPADEVRVVVCSVGDDQALTMCVLDLDLNVQQQPQFKKERLVTECAGASALKGVKVVLDPIFCRIYTCGHDECITLWRLDINEHEISIKSIASSPLATEGSCIDIKQIKNINGSVSEVIAVGGEGAEIQSIDVSILHAAAKLHAANYLLITAGAGFSADSGLSTYECAPAEYRDMCDPSNLMDKPQDFQSFWFQFTKSYLETKPHIGYELLNQWCHGGRLQHLRRKPNQNPWWVYSSNVDGYFRQFKSFEDSSLCEIHGSALEFRCACGIGYSNNGEPRLGWESWNEKMLSLDSCKQTTIKIDHNLLHSSSEKVFLCEHCNHLMRPNVLMFHDTDDNVLNPINIQRERYQAWEASVEEKVAVNNEKLVILELGCGVKVPAVRQESEEVLRDTAEKIKTTKGSKGSICLIRVNPKDAAIDIEGGDSLDTISISSTAASALQRVDYWLNVFAD